MSNLAVIVPTRGRPENIRELSRAFTDTKTIHAELILVCDDDDPKLNDYKRLPSELACSLFVFPREGKGMAKPLNKAANLLKEGYEYFAFMGDDHRPRTVGWDLQFINALLELGQTGLVYGNDLHQGAGLPTAVAMSADIVRELNGMVPPNMIHLYLDNFWLKLGTDLGKITYLPQTIIEHCHPYFGKAEMDEGYKDVNAPDVYQADKIAFDNYIASSDYLELLSALR